MFTYLYPSPPPHASSHTYGGAPYVLMSGVQRPFKLSDDECCTIINSLIITYLGTMFIFVISCHLRFIDTNYNYIYNYLIYSQHNSELLT
ncbi:hypothetical protein HanRHA438_Chr13g0599991 [Helianthus annuus]|nr:hypothetical protein HanRHA438_Chr13g0599991 [Helianthus annuus]